MILHEPNVSKVNANRLELSSRFSKARVEQIFIDLQKMLLIL